MSDKFHYLKKIIFILLISLIVLCFFMSSCRPVEIEYVQYFKNFKSRENYTTITEKLRLSDGVTVSQYDGVSGYFITQKNYFESEELRYGFCTADQELISPRFTNVLDIRGDYAVVTMPFASGDIIDYKVGIVKIRGEGSNIISSDYGFSYKYVPSIMQYSMLDSTYVAILGGKEETGTEYEEAIIYDYSSANGLLEVAKVDDVTNSTKFSYSEGHLIAQAPGIVRIYSINEINSEGYLTLKSYYVPFDEADGFSHSMVDVSPYYLGNNWFIFTGIYSSAEEYDTYEVARALETDEETIYYMTIRSKRYNAVTGQYYDTDRVSLVSNKYTSLLLKDFANIMNISNSNEYINLENQDFIQRVYSPPVVPTSEIIKDGYSIVYSYFPVYDIDNNVVFNDTFQIYNSNAERITLSNILMPIVYVDGKGLQNIDPNFKIPGRDIGYHQYSDGQRVTLLPLLDRIAYDPYIIHSDMIIASEFNLDRPLVNCSAAFDLNGNQITPFDYDIFTPYFGEYAIAGKNEKVGDLDFFKYYRIDKSGNVTPVNEYVFSANNGVYITKENGKFALYSNSGQKLLSADSSDISIVDDFFIDDYYIQSLVVTVENGVGVIYELG